MDFVAAAVMHGRVHYLLCALLVVTAIASRSIRTRQIALLLASWLFYAGWGMAFLCVLIASSLMNYALGAVLKRHVTVGRLWTGVALNVALLGFFKYGTAALVSDGRLGLFQQLIQPVGISFWTLEALSYLFDTYREEELDPTLLEFCLYMAFWPTVLTGPICRLPSLLPQFRQPIRPTSEDVSVGLTRILKGLFMKMILAEILGSGWSPGAGVNAGFDRVGGGWGGTDVWFLAVGFGFQLFFDFAGYSHIVIGATRLIGIRLEENFDRPFLSATPAAFWTRWHMSLSLWIRDYVFLQLAQLLRGRWWVYSSLLLSMVVCGLWHEASATFVVWGIYHGLLVVSHRIGQQVKRSLPFRWSRKFGVPMSHISTFSLVSVGWLFFRAHTVTQSLRMLRALFAFGSYRHLSLPATFYLATSAIILAWALFNAAAALIARFRAYEEGLRIPAEPQAVTSVADNRVRLSALAVELLDFSAARRWWWLAPAMIVVGLFFGLAINDLKPAPPTTPFMYSVF